MNFIKKNYALILALLLCFWAVKPLFVPGFFPMHDNEQVARLFDLGQALKAGNIPPRIAPNLGFGYGYPFFNFYPPFVYYLGQVFRLLSFSYIDSTKIVMFLGFISASVSMYLFSKRFFGKLGGLISAVMYTYSTYHAVDIYVRGALPEFWSFVFLPIIFLSYFELSKKQSLKYFLIASISSALLILTHNLIAFMASFSIFIWLVMLFYLSKEKKKFFILSVFSIVLSLASTAYFWLPSYFEKQYTMINLLTTELASYKIHFVCVKQLFYSPWGYGGSLPDCNSGLSLEIGIIPIIFSIVAIFQGFYAVKSKNKICIIIFVFLFFLLFSAFMTNVRSSFIWELIPPLWYVQFPWRFLLFSAFASSFLAGTIALSTSSKKYFLAILAIFFILMVNISHFQPEKYLTNAKDVDYISIEQIRWYTSKLAAEYTPLGIATKRSDANTTIIDINKDEIAKTSFQVMSGKISTVIKEDKPQYKKFILEVSKSGEFRINTYSFPGWKIYLDSKQVAYKDNNKLKLIAINVPTGKHILEAKFTDTMVRSVGNWMSLISLIILITLSLSNIIKGLDLRMSKSVL